MLHVEMFYSMNLHSPSQCANLHRAGAPKLFGRCRNQMLHILMILTLKLHDLLTTDIDTDRLDILGTGIKLLRLELTLTYLFHNWPDYQPLRRRIDLILE